MRAIELVYDADCPNVAAARASVRLTCQQLGIPPAWQEWERSAPGTPSYALGYGSPTILVDGSDVSGSDSQTDAAACRVYRAVDGTIQGAPPAELIVDALNGRPRGSTRAGASGWLAASGSVLAGTAALLPVLSCPACWPAYAGLLGALGIGFVNYTPLVAPALVFLVLLSLAGLVHGARRRGSLRPLLVGVAAAVVLLVGRLSLDSDPLMYAGVGLLVLSSLWNLTPARPGRTPCCPAPG